jgi:hypothetical protein
MEIRPFSFGGARDKLKISNDLVYENNKNRGYEYAIS